MKASLFEEAIDFLFYHPEEQTRKDNDEFNRVREKLIIKLCSTTHPLKAKLLATLHKAYLELSTITLIHKGGRSNNYDFLVKENNRKLEFKTSNAGKELTQLPQLFQFDAETEYATFFYNNYLPQIIKKLNIQSSPKPTLNDYLKQVKNIYSAKEDPFFKELKAKSKKTNIDFIVNSSIAQYLSKITPNKEKFEIYLNEYLQKDYLIWSFKEKDFFFHTFGNTEMKLNQEEVFISNNCLMFPTIDRKFVLRCLLRWKNGKGVLKPAYQVGLVKNSQCFRSNSLALIKELPPSAIKKDGIYFTPLKVRQHIWKQLTPYLKLGTSLLEPSFGSGEFLVDALEMKKNLNIFGCEINPILYQNVKETIKQRTHLINSDFFKADWNGLQFDFIVGNPPYYEVKGKINIATLFLMDCLHKYLKEGGILAFVLPRSFLNNRHLEETRKEIAQKFQIINLEIFQNEFYGTNIDVITIIIRKETPFITPLSLPYVINIKERFFIFHPKGKEIQEKYFNNRVKYLSEIEGITIKTGPIVWNEHKEKLADNKLPNSYPLLYGITTPQEFRNKEKKPFLIPNEKLKNKLSIGPFIIVSRGYGSHSIELKCRLIEKGEYFVENHLNVISSSSLTLLKQIEQCLNQEEVVQMFSNVLGNGQISKTELEQCFPLLAM